MLAIQFLDGILDILASDSAYGIGRAAIRRFEQMKEPPSQFYASDQVGDTIPLFDTSGAARAAYPFSHIRRPCAIDAPPILVDGEMILLRPVAVVPPDCSDLLSTWQTVHEICHMLSIGEYTLCKDGRISHCFGLNRYWYRCSSNGAQIMLDSRIERSEENELLNDAVTWHFLERMGKQRSRFALQPPDEFICLRCRVLKDSPFIKQIVGHYFTGNTEYVDSLLNPYG